MMFLWDQIKSEYYKLEQLVEQLHIVVMSAAGVESWLLAERRHGTMPELGQKLLDASTVRLAPGVVGSLCLR